MTRQRRLTPTIDDHLVDTSGLTSPEKFVDAGELEGGASSIIPGLGTSLSPQRKEWRRRLEIFFGNKLGVAGVFLLLLMIGFCFLGPLFYHTDQVNANLANALLTPGSGHPLGTDEIGYDELGRLMIGGQSSIEVGLAAAAVATIVGTIYGAISGFFGGIIDSIMMRIVDGLLAFPALFLLLLLATIFQTSKVSLIFIIAFFSWLGAARLIRGETLARRTRDYILAVRAMGGGKTRSITQHIIVNVIGTIVVFATFATADAILTLASLGFLGLGLRPPATDWGSMLSGGIQFVNTGTWWLIFPPGIAIVLVVIAFNFVGDALRDVFEVRLRQI
jgi:peptide/nickel transport system permease protein